MAETRQLLRIGELSRRAGVTPELLRAWERRYGLLEPTRSPGGLRLYSLDDLARVEAMQRHLASGVAAAQAAELATRRAGPAPGQAPLLAGAADELAEALAAFDEGRAQELFDELVASVSVDALLNDVVLPYLHDLGERWARGEASIAQEHFATSLVRGRLLGLARGWGRGMGPRIVLACPPGELHDLGLIAFGLALQARGWRIVFLGTDTPVESVDAVVQACEPRFAVLGSVDADALRRSRKAIETLAARVVVCVGGAGAAEAGIPGVEVLASGPVEEAERLTRLALGH